MNYKYLILDCIVITLFCRGFIPCPALAMTILVVVIATARHEAGSNPEKPDNGEINNFFIIRTKQSPQKYVTYNYDNTLF